jgi:hypothetical protein
MEPGNLNVSFTKDSLEAEIKDNLNLEEKYADLIELWNTVKFYLQFSVRLELR